MRLRIFPDIFGIPLTDIILRQLSAISADFSSRKRQFFWKEFPVCLFSSALFFLVQMIQSPTLQFTVKATNNCI